jgi:hypothetical protein
MNRPTRQDNDKRQPLRGVVVSFAFPVCRIPDSEQWSKTLRIGQLPQLAPCRRQVASVSFAFTGVGCTHDLPPRPVGVFRCDRFLSWPRVIGMRPPRRAHGTPVFEMWDLFRGARRCSIHSGCASSPTRSRTTQLTRTQSDHTAGQPEGEVDPHGRGRHD